MLTYPKAIDFKMVGKYPAHTKSGGGYFYDHVLEYRVWCRPWLGAPDEFEGEMYYYAFASYEEALEFSNNTEGSEMPLVLIRQLEWINEPEPQNYIHEKGERLTEWQVEWLIDGKREETSISQFMSRNGV
nr:hypothetical protein [uncultured Pseudomonas sp.]